MSSPALVEPEVAAMTPPELVKVREGLARMLQGGVIMDVVNPEQARLAEKAGACAVMALERVPADIRAEGGVARMSDPEARAPLSLPPSQCPAL